jgi:hypothetical protein
MSTGASGVRSAPKSQTLNPAGDFLQPDDITFSTLVRGYGDAEPPQWSGISTVLATMQQRFGMRPDTGGMGCGLDRPSNVCALAPVGSCQRPNQLIVS